jgi:hypothetical protein
MLHSAALWCKMPAMAKAAKLVRQSVSLPPRVASRVQSMARNRKTSANRVLVNLIEAGLQHEDTEKDRFFALAQRLTESHDVAERRRIKKELARMTFGE